MHGQCTFAQASSSVLHAERPDLQAALSAALQSTEIVGGQGAPPVELAAELPGAIHENEGEGVPPVPVELAAELPRAIHEGEGEEPAGGHPPRLGHDTLRSFGNFSLTPPPFCVEAFLSISYMVLYVPFLIAGLVNCTRTRCSAPPVLWTRRLTRFDWAIGGLCFVILLATPPCNLWVLGEEAVLPAMLAVWAGSLCLHLLTLSYAFRRPDMTIIFREDKPKWGRVQNLAELAYPFTELLQILMVTGKTDWRDSGSEDPELQEMRFVFAFALAALYALGVGACIVRDLGPESGWTGMLVYNLLPGFFFLTIVTGLLHGLLVDLSYASVVPGTVVLVFFVATAPFVGTYRASEQESGGKIRIAPAFTACDRTAKAMMCAAYLLAVGSGQANEWSRQLRVGVCGILAAGLLAGIVALRAVSFPPLLRLRCGTLALAVAYCSVSLLEGYVDAAVSTCGCCVVAALAAALAWRAGIAAPRWVEAREHFAVVPDSPNQIIALAMWSCHTERVARRFQRASA